MEFKIGKVGFTNDRTVIIAEAGVNHLGRMDYAEELIKTAARAGADIVKFQTYKAEKLTIKEAPRFWDWDGEKKENGSQFDSYSLLDSFEKPQYEELVRLCEKYNVEFMSTPFDFESVDMLVDIGMKGFKIASCDITNIPFLQYVAAKRMPVLLSTGAANIDEIRTAVRAIENQNNHHIAILHCTLCYPTAPEDVNLRALMHIQQEFPEFLLGISDHTLGTVVPAASVLYGARIIEKHYTFDKTLPDSADHWLSLDERELSCMVNDARTLEMALGDGVKRKLDCETATHKYARRSIVANRDIKKGAIVTALDLTFKRPGTGLPPVLFDELVGKVSAKDIKEDTMVTIDDFID